jgi:hypothetical protein
MSLWRKTPRETLELAFRIFSVLTILNFFVFVGLTAYLGGDAVNGKTEPGHYFLWGYKAYSGRRTTQKSALRSSSTAGGMSTASASRGRS